VKAVLRRRRRGQSQTRAEAAGAGARDAELARVEALLFSSREPLSAHRLSQMAALEDATAARTAVRRLNRLYDGEGSSFRVEELGGGFQLRTRAKFGAWLRRVHRYLDGNRLSLSALETLAVVAYRQPALRADIEAVRGVQSGEALKNLLERDLIRIVGRSQELGRPFLYGTTKRFLQVFGLRHLDELPRAEYLRGNRESPAGVVLPPGQSNRG
jgi:segregation and condensation protein B